MSNAINIFLTEKKKSPEMHMPYRANMRDPIWKSISAYLLHNLDL